VLWVKPAWSWTSESGNCPFPDSTMAVQADIEEFLRIVLNELPNVKLMFASSRIYAGWATNNLSPEPCAYQNGFAVKWAIEQSISDPTLPWIAWGPYLWDPTWDLSFYRDDKTHPSNKANEKVAKQLMQFFKNDSKTKTWFLVESLVSP